MVQYECNRCHKKFDKKHNYDVHMKRKIPCPEVVIIPESNLPKLTEQEKNDNICNYCNKSFCNKYTLERHLNDRCKIKKKDVDNKETMFIKLMTEIGELKKSNEQQNMNNKKEISDLKKQNNELIKITSEQNKQIKELKKYNINRTYIKSNKNNNLEIIVPVDNNNNNNVTSDKDSHDDINSVIVDEINDINEIDDINEINRINEANECIIKNVIPYKKKSIPKAIRMKAWEITIGDTIFGNCYCCEREVKIDNFDCAHIIAEKNGGETSLNNLQVTCKPCNLSCGIMNLNDFKKSMNNKLIHNL